MGNRHTLLFAFLTIALAGQSSALPEDGEDAVAPPASKVRSFDQVLLRPLRVEYTEEFLSNEKRRKQQIEGKALERLRKDYQEVVTKKLGDRLPTTSEPGPRVVRVEGLLIDHVMDKREWEATSSSFQGAPNVTIVAYLRDSETGEILDEVGISLGPRPGRLMKSSAGFYWDFMRSVFDRLGTRLRWKLEGDT